MGCNKYYRVIVLLALAATTSAWGAAYTMTDLGNLGGTVTTVAGINANGQICGTSQDSSNVSHGYLWANGHMTSIDSGTGSVARAINASGEIAGNDSAGIVTYANGVLTTVGIPLNGISVRANGINASGEVTGQLKLANSQIRGFLYNPADGTTTNILTMSGVDTDFSYGSSVNATGHIEGDSINTHGLDHAYIWYDNAFTDLGTLGGNDSSGIQVNDAGDAVGTGELADTPSATIFHPFLFTGGTMHDLGTLGGNYGNCGGLNDFDTVVGYTYLTSADTGETHAFIYANGAMTDLNNLIPANSGWTLTNASGINDSGDIVVNAVNNGSGVQDAFLLTPVPEPAGLFLVAGGSVLTMVRHRRRVTTAAIQGLRRQD